MEPAGDVTDWFMLELALEPPDRGRLAPIGYAQLVWFGA